MSVIATIYLKKIVPDLDKADDWFEEVRLLIKDKTTCRAEFHSTRQGPRVEIQEVKESE